MVRPSALAVLRLIRLELGRLRHRQVGGLIAPENANPHLPLPCDGTLSGHNSTKRKDIEVTLRIFSATFAHSHCPCFALLTPSEVQSCITAKMTVSILSPLAGGDP